MEPGFPHRVLYGWISEFANRPLPGKWPQIPLDDQIIGDLESYFDLCVEVGYNEVVIWGLFMDRQWPVDIASCLDAARRHRIRRVIDAAHSRGLKILCGLGVYSWGFEQIIAAFPELGPTNCQALCPAMVQSHAWMAKVVDFVLSDFDLDGLEMQSADQGRCECPKCKGLSAAEYHARLNIEVADHVRGRWTGRLLVVDNWGLPFTEPAWLPPLVEMAAHVDYVIDHNDSAAAKGRDHRRRLIAAMPCPFGTFAGRSVWPPQRWPRDKWFLPTTLINADYVRDLRADGARAIAQFVTTLANPAGEITLRFMGSLLTDADAAPQELLHRAVDATYEPRDRSTSDALAEIVAGAESAYYQSAPPRFEDRAELLSIDGGLFWDGEPNPANYLLKMSPEARRAYARRMGQLATAFDRVRGQVAQTEKADLTARCFRSALADAATASDAMFGL